MNRLEFPSCCAIELLTDLGRTVTSMAGNSTNEEIIDFILNQREYNYAGKIQMIVLNEVQLNSIGEELFLNLGFKITCIGLYTGHGNKIYTLIFNKNGNP